MKQVYAQLTRSRALSFGGQGHVQTFDVALGHDIQREDDTVIVSKGEETIHFPWAAVEYAVPMAEPSKGDGLVWEGRFGPNDISVTANASFPPDKAWLIGHETFTQGPSGSVRVIGIDRGHPMREAPCTFDPVSFNEALGAVLDDAAGQNAMKYVGIDRVDATPEPSQAHAEGDDHAVEKGELEEGPRGKHQDRDRRR